MGDDQPTPEQEEILGFKEFKEAHEAAQLEAKNLAELLDSPLMKEHREAFSNAKKQLDEITKSILQPVHIPTRTYEMLRPPERPEVKLLRDVHGELEGMATLLTEGARQTAALATITKANLDALQAVITELKETRKAASWSNGVLIALTVAVLLATAVGAIALEKEFTRQLAGFWSWLQGLLR